MTRTSLESGADARQAAEGMFRETKPNGVLVLIVKDTKKLEIVVGKHTYERFTDSDVSQLRSAILSKFKIGDFDGGVVAGAEYLETQLVRDFAIGRAPASSQDRTAGAREMTDPRARQPFQPVDRSGGGGGIGIIGLILAIVVIGFIFRAIGGFFRMLTGGGGYASGPGYAGGGYGGGMFNSILGSMFGAAAGNWMYDRFFRGGGGMTDFTSHGGNQGYGGGGYDGSQMIGGDSSFSSDNGEIGGSFDGGWGGGDDGSGGGGGDW